MRARISVLALTACLIASRGGSGPASAQSLSDAYDITAPPFGCTASTTTESRDDSACIQAAIDAADKAGGGVVWVASGYWNLTGQVVVKANVTLECAGNGDVYDAGDLPTAASGAVTYARPGGSVFAVDWGSGQGASDTAADAAVQLRHGAAIKDCGFYYPRQIPAASVPIEYGSTILAYDDGGDTHQTATGNWCANCYNFLDFRGSIAGRGVVGAYVADNIGSPIHYGLALNYIVDWGTFRDDHFNSGAIDGGDPKPAAHLRGWIAANGIGWYIGYSDWVVLTNEQAWGYGVSVYIDFKTKCCGDYRNTGPITIQNGQFDASRDTIVFAGTAHFGVKILGGSFTAFNPYSFVRGAVFSVANGAVLPSLQMEGAYIFGPTGQVIWACQPNQTIGDVSVVDVHAATDGSAADAFQLCSAKSLYIAGSTYRGF
jgi:hypothetical protein